MILACEECQARLEISSEKLAEPDAKVCCPKCSSLISINAALARERQSEAIGAAFGMGASQLGIAPGQDLFADIDPGPNMGGKAPLGEFSSAKEKDPFDPFEDFGLDLGASTVRHAAATKSSSPAWMPDLGGIDLGDPRVLNEKVGNRGPFEETAARPSGKTGIASISAPAIGVAAGNATDLLAGSIGPTTMLEHCGATQSGPTASMAPSGSASGTRFSIEGPAASLAQSLGDLTGSPPIVALTGDPLSSGEEALAHSPLRSTQCSNVPVSPSSGPPKILPVDPVAEKNAASGGAKLESNYPDEEEETAVCLRPKFLYSSPPHSAERKAAISGLICSLSIACVAAICLSLTVVSYSRERALPPAPLEISDVSNGFYSTRAGRAVYVVQGLAKNRTGGELQRAKAVVQLRKGSTVARTAEAIIGATPSPENLYSISSVGQLAELIQKLSAEAIPLKPGATAPFSAIFYEYPDDLVDYSIGIDVVPGG